MSVGSFSCCCTPARIEEQSIVTKMYTTGFSPLYIKTISEWQDTSLGYVSPYPSQADLRNGLKRYARMVYTDSGGIDYGGVIYGNPPVVIPPYFTVYSVNNGPNHCPGGYSNPTGIAPVIQATYPYPRDAGDTIFNNLGLTDVNVTYPTGGGNRGPFSQDWSLPEGEEIIFDSYLQESKKRNIEVAQWPAFSRDPIDLYSEFEGCAPWNDFHPFDPSVYPIDFVSPAGIFPGFGSSWQGVQWSTGIRFSGWFYNGNSMIQSVGPDFGEFIITMRSRFRAMGGSKPYWIGKAHWTSRWIYGLAGAFGFPPTDATVLSYGYLSSNQVIEIPFPDQLAIGNQPVNVSFDPLLVEVRDSLVLGQCNFIVFGESPTDWSNRTGVRLI